MRLLEAILTGKSFRRPADKNYWRLDRTTGYVIPDTIGDIAEILPVTLDMLQSDDWILDDREIH